ncbi:MAG: hypothetical protein DWQ20_00565, partial [Actinobacteria bacterium]
LGMFLDVSPSMAIADGLMVALPYLLLMATMVVTQYVQQWHSTYGQERPKDQPGAGTTQAITKIMPLFIGVISYQFPAGLGLYWATSNLFRLGQQVLIFRIDGRPTTPSSADEDEDTKSSNGDEPKQSKPQQGAADKRRRRRRK